jgi:hypothetical protein
MSRMRDKLRYVSSTDAEEHKSAIRDDALIYLSVFLIAGLGLVLSLLFWTY